MLDRARSPLPWLAALLALYLLAPVVAFVVRLTSGVSSAPGLGDALLTSLLTASVSAAIIAVLGVPLAYVLAHARGPLARLALALVSLPLALPPLMSGLLLLYVVGPNTAAGRLFGGQLTETRIGIVLAQTFVAAPFLIITARAAFAAVDPALEDVARTLGHGRLGRFRHVAIPAALGGIGAGLLLAWLRSFAEFGATIILAYHPYSLPVFTFVQFGSTGLPATKLPVAVALAVALAVLLASGVRVPARRRQGLGLALPAVQGALADEPPVDGSERQSVDRPVVPVYRPSRDEPVVLDFALRKRLPGFSLDVAHRAESPHLALLGPSGAGKTLTLRLLAGLVPNDGGHLRAGSRALEALASERREIGYVPQSSALLPRRTVWRQVTFGARAQPHLAAWWLDRLGLSGLEHRYPHQLSGGQQRRVALARALAVRPRVLLLDEPFTGLDAPVRDTLRRDLRRLQREGAFSTVLVTHDPEEAAMLAEEVIVIEDGHALQAGRRQEVFKTPASPRVASLLGISNAHPGNVVRPDTLRSKGVDIRAPTHGLPAGSEVVWCVRPERIRVHAHGDDPDAGHAAILLDDVDLGATRELTVALAGALELTVRTTLTEALAPGASVAVEIDAQEIAVWESDGS